MEHCTPIPTQHLPSRTSSPSACGLHLTLPPRPFDQTWHRQTVAYDGASETKATDIERAAGLGSPQKLQQRSRQRDGCRS